MIRLKKNINKKILKKKIIIFDLDGVLINSKLNMKKSWQQVQKKFDLKNISFNNYFQHIGKPFETILNELKIFENHKKIKKCYDSSSIKNLYLINYYPNTINILKLLHKNNYKLCIVTSKDKVRTKIILKEYNYLFNYIQCPEKNIKGKPNSEPILKVIKKLKCKKYQCLYVGDTNIDYLTAKNANIDFLFAEWGYGIKKTFYKYSIKKISEINKIME